MLINVNVKNLALISQADVCFDAGMNIMTGETGAGKSIIIGSILIALGGKVPKDMLREQDQEALVELVFQISDEELKHQFEDMGVTIDEDGQLIISRRIVKGRSLIRVNGESVNVSNLKKITELLIDIHGQHDHQSLLKTSKHLEILDKFGEEHVSGIKAEVASHYRQWKALKKQMAALEMDEETRNREIAFCRYEIEEIENAHLSPGEYEEVERSYKKALSSVQLIEKMNELYGITGSDQGGSISEQISYGSSVVQSLLSLDEGLENLASAFQDLESICSDINREIRNYVESVSYDASEVTALEERNQLLNTLRQKYAGISTPDTVIEKILEYKEKQEAKLTRLLHMEEEKEACRIELQKEEERLLSQSGALSEERKHQAAKLEEKIVSVLQGLNFLDVKFHIEFHEEQEFHENGMDAVEFLISTNPGEPLRPLVNVASGGELSRIMLGIKTILASGDKIDTLIFDEIDTGISGKTAQKVAERMKEISRCHQIICITHLPQIAAMADSHYLIEKKVEADKTRTCIQLLDEDASVHELARMLGGAEITPAVLENAREMKRQNHD